jgi:hypothetical protein
MPWFGLRLAENEPSATRNAPRRQDREPAPPHVEGHHQRQVGVPAEAIPDAPAIALRDWLVGEGWDDLFLDHDPERGLLPASVGSAHSTGSLLGYANDRGN